MFKSKKINIQIYLSVLLASLILFANVLVFIYYRNTKSKIEESYISELKTQFEIVMGVYSYLSDIIYHFHIEKPEIKKLFAQGVQSESYAEKDHYRKLLYHKLSEMYNMLCKYNFRQLHFHETNNRSYLRFHRPEKFGDDLTGIRYSVEYVNREKKSAFGFEEGRIFNGYRFVYPVLLGDQHIGSVEISISMKTIVDQLSERFNQKSQFIILKSQVEKKVFEDEMSNYTAWFVDDDYLLDSAVSSECILQKGITVKDTYKIKDALIENRKNSKPFCTEIKVDSEPFMMTFWPINNFKDKNVGYIFTLSDGKDIRNLDITFYYISFLMFALFVLIIFFTLYYRSSQKKIQKLATFDSLTNVYIRRAIMAIIESEYERSKRYQTSFSVVMIDIDHFKNVNDTYGHSVGDSVLVRIAEIIRTSIRKTDALGRYGGEEFIVSLPGTEESHASIVAEKLRKKVSEYDFPKVGRVTMSLGVAGMSQQLQSTGDLIKEADKKLYIAKHEGRNRVVH